MDMQRAVDTRALLDAIRDRHDELTGHYYPAPSLVQLRAWVNALHPLTLNRIASSLNRPAEMNLRTGEPWGATIDFVFKAHESEADDNFTALLFFITEQVTPNGKVCALVGGWGHRTDETVPIYRDSLVYLCGLYDTLRYHSNYVATSKALGLLDENIYASTQDSQQALAGLLKVTDALVQSESKDFLLSDQSAIPNAEDTNKPWSKYGSYTGAGSIRLRNGELVEYVLNNPDKAPYIAAIIAERKTDDLEIIKTIFQQGALAVSGGVL